jgi:hypothetical protein
VGRSWQTSRASALLCGVAFDAATIVKRVSDFVTHFQQSERHSVSGVRVMDGESLQHSS